MCAWSARAGRCRSSRSHYEHLALVRAGPAGARAGAGGASTTTRLWRSSRWSCSSRTSSCARGWLPASLSALRRRHHDLSWRGRCSSPPTSRCRRREKKQGIAAFAGNHALCKITEDLIFTDPYRDGRAEPLDRALARCDRRRAFARTCDLHVAISRLKLKFMARPEALIHGDLHTGSIMVTESETRVIDPEFAFYGPMGFDVGAVLGNLIMGYLASAGHERSPGERRAFEAWMLETIENVWTEFSRKFVELWRTEAQRRRVSRSALRRQKPARRASRPNGRPIWTRLFRGHRRLRRGKNHPPHPRSRAQYRFRMDRGPAGFGRSARREVCVSPARCCWTCRRSVLD